MVQNILVKILLAPFSLLYGLAISTRNFFFSAGIVKRSTFNIPVINVGNLTIGGTGKSPHVEYLIRLLKPYLDIAILSRGYGRKTKGFQFVKHSGDANQFGDEPLQFKRKNPEMVVAVAESRALGIPEILKYNPKIKAIVLDDAFQHLSVKPSLNILLTEQSRLFIDDYLLPSGRLREWRSAYERADIIVVTKCRKGFGEKEREEIMNKIELKGHQKIYFSHYVYGDPYFMYNPSQRIKLKEAEDVILVSAIANTDYMEEYLESFNCNLHYIQYEDHHYFTEHEVSQIKSRFDEIEGTKKIILSSEKDCMRLDLHRDFLLKNKLPIFAIPIKVEFLFDQGSLFDSDIKKHLLNFKI